MSRNSFLLAAPFALFLSACVSEPGPSAPTPSPEPEARTDWERLRPEHFAYSIVNACEDCRAEDSLPYFVVASRQGVSSVHRIVDGDTVVLLTGLQSHSVDTMLERIARRLASDSASLNVSYDSAYRFPARVHHAQSGTGTSIRDFRVLPQAPAPARTVQNMAERWAASKPARYAYTLYRGCFCPAEYVGPFRVTVSGDSVTSVRWLPSTGDSVAVTQNLRAYSIDSVTAVLRPGAEPSPDHMQARYDGATGLPAEIRIDYYIGTVDDEMLYRISDFRALP